MIEEWRAIPGYVETYEVSNTGKVRNKRGKIRKASTDRYGYLQLKLNSNKIKRYYKVHQLVLLAFVGPCPVFRQPQVWYPQRKR